MIKEEELQSIIGTKSGQLTVVQYVGYYSKNGDKHKRHWFKCLCSCGTEVIIEWSHLKPSTTRQTKSCGCSHKTHGYANHPAYISYKCMMGRVRNPDLKKHKHYIINNIRVCEEWNGHPDVFCQWADENGFQRGLTLDRIDSYGDYTPSNCRWVTPAVQANNRPSYNNNITYKGRTQTITAWSKELGIPVGTIRSRLKDSKLSVEEALSKPVDKRFSRAYNYNKD